VSDTGKAFVPEILWSWLLGSTSFDAARTVGIGPGGTVLIAGTSAGDLSGQGNLGGSDAVLIRLTKEGKKLSVLNWGSIGVESVSGMVVAADGASFVTGYSTGRIDNFVNRGGSDAFLARFEPDGKRSWTRLWGTSESDYPQAVTLGSAGSIYVAGFTEGYLGGTPTKGDDSFISSFDTSGALIWTRVLGSGFGHYATAITADTARQEYRNGAVTQGDRLYVAGAVTGPWLGSTYRGGASDAFLIALDSMGNTIWTKEIGTSGDDWARAVAVGRDGEVYVAGESGGSLDGLAFSGGASDIFLSKFSADGVLEWTRILGSSASDTVSAIVVASDGSIYLTGTTYGSLDGQSNLGGDDVFVARYLPNGTRSWVLQTGTSDNDVGLAISTLDESLVIAGYSEGNFGSQINSGASDVFVASIKSVLSTVQFSITVSSSAEGNNGSNLVTVQATLSVASTETVTVPISYSGTAGSGTDYTNATSSITITAGQTTGSATFSVIGDSTVEPNETIILTMGTPTNATLGTNKVYTHTVLNDDLAAQPVSRTHSVNVLVDKGVLGSIPVLLKDLVEEITTTGTTVTSHTMSYRGTKFRYSDIDALITTVIRDGEFTEEFRKEIVDQFPSVGGITYKDAVSLVGAANIDAILISVAGADGNYVG
jgi:hypothetical protein